MTSKISVQACCVPDKEVVVHVDGPTPEEYILKDGQLRDFYVYDDRTIRTYEREVGSGRVEPPTSALSADDEESLRWRMELIVRYAMNMSMPVTKAAEQFRAAETSLVRWTPVDA